MSDNSKIEWMDASWNPVTGCSNVSEGCRNCYARRVTERFHGKGSFDKIVLRPDRLDQPLKWRKPRRIFVNSMSDLFHEDIPDNYIGKVFVSMSLARQHIFQVLTKRPERMMKILNKPPLPFPLKIIAGEALPNVWLGISVEDQKTADERIPILLQTKASVRFVSYEPALGPINFRAIGSDLDKHDPLNGVKFNPGYHRKNYGYPKINWIICGGESGPGARPMHPDWARTVRDQCQAAGVPFFMKQMAKKAPIPDDLFIRQYPHGQELMR